MHPATIPLKIIQGATLRDTLRIMQPRFEYRPIAAIASTAPVRLTAEHDLPANWLAWVQGVTGMQELNRTPRRELPHRVEVIDDTTLEINTLSAVGLSPQGGQLIYQPPVDLTGATARMQILDRPDGTVLADLSAHLTVGQHGTIERELDETETDRPEWDGACYFVEVVYPDGTVHRYFQGPVILELRGGTRGRC